MKLAITGVPGSGSTEIGKALSERLGLTFISAEQTISYLNITNDVLDDVDTINKINRRLVYQMLNESNFVCDSIISSTCVQDTIDIFLYSSLFLEEMAPRTLADKRAFKSKIADIIHSRDYTNPNYYHIWIDRTGIDDSTLVEFIVNKLYDYSLFHYVPARMCIPAPDVTEIDSKYNKDYSYPVTRHLASYLVHENLSTLDASIRSNELIPVTFLEDGCTVQDPKHYDKWFNMYENNYYVQLTTYLSWYCMYLETDKVDDTYCVLEHSGRVLERLKQWYDRVSV